MGNLKRRIINEIIDIEGGYVNDVNDSGGETNFGITIKVARKNGYKGMMINFPRSLAYDIYEKKYWNSLSADEILKLAGQEVVSELVDTGVNMGVTRSAKFLQRGLNALNYREKYGGDLDVDGRIGRKTLEALIALKDDRGESGFEPLVKIMDSLQGAFYVKLSERRAKDRSFIYGWFKHRIRNVD